MILYPTDLSEQTADYTIIRNINLLCCRNLRQTWHSHNITGQNYDKAGACCNAAVADSNLKAARTAQQCRVIGEGLLGFSHADRQVAVAKLFKFLKGFVCFLSIVHAVSTINFFSDGFNLAFQAHI